MIGAFSRNLRLLAAWLTVIGVVIGTRSDAAESVLLAELSQATHFHGIAVDPRDSGRIYLATHHGFFVATPDGRATRVSQAADDFMGFTPHPGDATVLYASGHLAGGGNVGLVVSTDGGATWQQLSLGLDGPADFHQLTASRSDPNTIYGAFRGLQVSRDGGRTWTRAGPAPDGLIDLAGSTRDGDTLYAATKGGLLISRDAGASWRPAHVLTASASVVETDGRGAVYAFILGQGLATAKEDALGGWTVLNNGFGDRYLLHLAIDPSDPARLYAVTQHSEVMVSADGGRSWQDFGSR